MTSPFPTRLSLVTALAALALNLTAPAPAEAQSYRAELLAGAERGQAAHRRGDEHRRYGHERRGNGRHKGHSGGHHSEDRYYDDHYYDSKYYKAKHRKARNYAREAIAQAGEARRLGFYPDHPRWSLNFDRHYRWALDRPPRKLEREHYRRAAKLRDLRAYHYRYGDHHRRRHSPYGHQ